MKCEYCKDAVHGKSGITVLGLGAAHKSCFEREQVMRRMFKGIDISALSNECLNELQDLVLCEVNFRNRLTKDNDIELF